MKNIWITFAFLTTGLLFSLATAGAKTLPINDKLIQEPNQYSLFSGTITQIDQSTLKTGDGSKEAYVNIQNVPILRTSDGKTITNHKFAIGDKIHYVVENGPMIMIYPPKYRAKTVIINDSKDIIKLSWFDKNLMSHENNPKNNALLKPENAQITELITGKTMRPENIVEKNLIVFYTTSAKSMPPQILAKHIYILPYPEFAMPSQNEDIKPVRKPDTKISNKYQSGTMYVLSDFLNSSGFLTQWDNSSKTLTVTKEGHNARITANKKIWMLNGQEKTMEKKAQIVKNKMQVEGSVLNELRKI